MYPPPPPPLGRAASSSSSHNSLSASSPSSSTRLTTNTVLGSRSQPASSSPLTSNVFSHDHTTTATSSSTLPAEGPPANEEIDWVFTPPVLVKHGMFAGRSLRFALAVAQEPVLGRRKTEKDRRPIGPAPIVRFRAMEQKRRRRSGGSGSGTGSEEEVDPSSIEPSHLICAAELGPPSEKPNRSIGIPSTSHQASSSKPKSRYAEEDGQGVGDVDVGSDDDDDQGGFFAKERVSNIRSGSGAPPRQVPEESMIVDNPSSEDELKEDEPDQPISMMQSGYTSRTQSANRSGGSSRTETGGSSKGVRNLYGNLHVAGVRVPAPEGGMGTWFLFTDLSVRQEGTYSLRFRCFDLTAIASDEGVPAPCLVEAQSQPFRVYSPRQVPPLPKPTDLAEHFAKQGFKLNTRKNERTASSPPPSSTSQNVIPPPPMFSDKPNKKPSTGKTKERPAAKPLQDSDSGRSHDSGKGASTGSSIHTVHDISGESGSVVLSGSGGSRSSVGLAAGSAGSGEGPNFRSIVEDERMDR
uniref:Velvet domain-containing protein n=1 Tax=Kwoniella bestiolae CBS 10118 TaxID=1296100 RepID=A0A1B9G9X4_9TREE|nr:hypothetical protein I302_02668 [Kwoniella bestiolae CBS 10118]OCF27819.1 hypothetical protein I302_02668 [Kwoniella bestiolae CBS 10118]